MAALITIVLGIAAFLLASRFREKQRLQLAATREIGRVQHLRTGEYPSSCSWCKNTALARKLIVFERSTSGWRSTDLMSRLLQCEDAQVATLASALASDQPAFRRFCTERCTREFFTSENASALEAFGPCEYCSVRFPIAVMRCNNCGAARR